MTLSSLREVLMERNRRASWPSPGSGLPTSDLDKRLTTLSLGVCIWKTGPGTSEAMAPVNVLFSEHGSAIKEMQGCMGVHELLTATLTRACNVNLILDRQEGTPECS